MKFIYAIVLAAASTAVAKKHGTPVHVKLTGKMIGPVNPETVAAANAAVKAWCGDIGAANVHGIIDDTDGTIMQSCDCAHGNTGLPLDIGDGTTWSAHAIWNGECR
ncbi:hypothetical protein E4U55_003755 [Claviceps digitariae]|nr:hypothetical protein E4U55_003755 [Claviceps digitariae]